MYLYMKREKEFTKKVLGVTMLLLLCVTTYAQQTFPLSAKQDKEGIMDKAYWKLWNPKVQAQIDQDMYYVYDGGQPDTLG